MTIYKQIEDYIVTLCIKHKKVLHNSGGTAFTPLHFDEESFVNNKLKPVYVRIEDCAAQYRNEQMQWTVPIKILKNVPSAGALNRRVETISAASGETLQIALDFEARIRHMYEDECFFIQSLLPFSIEPIGMEDQSAFGWRLTLRFTTTQIGYDINKWEA